MTNVKNAHTEKQADAKVVEQAQPEVVEQAQPEVVEPTQAETPDQRPVFDEIQNMNQATALSVLIQTAELAQKAGVLTMRDSVICAKAISLFAPDKV